MGRVLLIENCKDKLKFILHAILSFCTKIGKKETGRKFRGSCTNFSQEVFCKLNLQSVVTRSVDSPLVILVDHFQKCALRVTMKFLPGALIPEAKGR